MTCFFRRSRTAGLSHTTYREKPLPAFLRVIRRVRVFATIGAKGNVEKERTARREVCIIPINSTGALTGAVVADETMKTCCRTSANKKIAINGHPSVAFGNDSVATVSHQPKIYILLCIQSVSR